MHVQLTDPRARLQHALDLSYRYLGHRERTVVEVRTHLASRRVEPDTIDETLAELTEQGYVDDDRFARLFAEDRRRLDSWGAERIERRLVQYGVPRESIDAALAALGPADELAAALDVLARRLAEPPADDRSRERALRLLVRRGYGLELAHEAVRTFERAER